MAEKAQTTKKYKKPSSAPVRHTLTSMYRLLKANPLLKYQLNGEQIPEFKTDFKDKVPERVLQKTTSTSQKPALVRTQSARQPLNKKTAVTKQKTVTKPAVTIEKQEVFKTPNNNKRRTLIFATPRTSVTSTPAPSAYDLQRRLNEWLKKHGKPIKSYNHLKQFNIKHDTITKNEENKENIEVNEDKDDSYEELGIIPEEPIKIEKVKTEAETQRDLENVAKDPLKDLRKLILEGYPREQCEAWLGAIRKKYKKLEEDPLYWECLAALEETVGHLSTAVEYYRTAIVQGAEVREVDESLEQMLQKFSLLNINSAEKQNTDDNENKPKYDRNKIVLAARNVFKSSIIQFAIEERKQKKGKNASVVPEEKRRVMVTPVRRSTRRRTGYVVTPNVEMCASVEKIKGYNEGIEFRHNQTLASKFF